MLSYNFKYELKLLLRSKWIQILIVVLLALFLFAGYNGQQKVTKRIADIDAAQLEMKNADAIMLSLLDSIENGLSVNSVPYWRTPDQPTAAGNNYPRVAAMTPNALTFTAVGQSDLFTHYIKPTVTGEDFTLNFGELSSPVQLLFGSFDLAFVIIYLLPLIIIAFSYNILSYEKEHGSLKLLASEPISLFRWVLQKVVLRFFWIAVITILAIVVTLVVNQVSFPGNLSKILAFVGLTLSYILFWFTLAFLINLWLGSSAKNAVGLMGFWVILVLVAPAAVNQMVNALYPMPSRTRMVNEMRALKAASSKKQDAILASYLRDHPEYAQQDTAKYSYWHRYMASQKVLKQELEPLLNTYENQIKKQQEGISKLRIISPAIIMQESLSGIAGTSTLNYEDYRKQVVDFAGDWRDYFLPLLYRNETFTSGLVTGLPQFEYRERVKIPVLLNILLILSGGVLLSGLGLVLYQRNKARGNLISN